MTVFRLLYTSRAVRKPDRAELTDLIRVASLRNMQAGITGLLCHAEPHFLQVLEGPVGAVNTLLRRLVRDPRHADLAVLSAGPAPIRLFPHWGMRLTQAADAPGGEYARLLGTATDPAEVDPAAVLAFLRRVADYAPLPPEPARRG